jgi:hypothetical protein
MKYTQYFLYTRNRTDRACIKDEWIEKAIKHPIHTQVQADGRIRHWAKIEEVDKYLRIILLDDGQTVHNAFFDRTFKLSGETQ